MVRHRLTNKTYIEKRARPRDINTGYIQHEVRVMQQLRGHPNIVEVVNYDLDYHHLGYGSVYMQRAELGSLDALIKRFADRRSQLPDEGFAWKVLYDLSIALAFLWTGTDARTAKQKAAEGQNLASIPGWNPVMHRDIKPANVLMTWKDPLQVDTCPYPTILLGDFGCAVTLQECGAGSANPPHNDAVFAPPEQSFYSEKADIYSMALVVICLAYRQQLPPRCDPFSNGWASEGLKMVLTKCLRAAAKDRPTPFELPKLVWRGYQMWSRTHGTFGVRLPQWAFG